jgi:hypothetical protein
LKGSNQKKVSTKKKNRKEEKEISSLHPQIPYSLDRGRNSPAPFSAVFIHYNIEFY